MIITTTSETIEILLSTNVATSQASFSCSFNELSGTTLIPYDSNGTTNNTTPVTIMGSPSSNSRRQLRKFYIVNNDTASITLTVRYNNTSVTRTIFYAVLQVGDNLVFNQESGWGIYTSFGERRYDTATVIGNGTIRPAELSYAAGNGSQIISPSPQAAISLGKAEKAHTGITVCYRTTNPTVSVTSYAELAIYKVCQPMGIATQQQHFRLGFVDTSSIWNTIGIIATTIPISGCKKGDDLYVIFANSGSQVAFRYAAYADALSSMFRTINSVADTWRPSLTEQYVPNAFNSANAGIFVSWQGR